jgi:aminopeptidase N
MFKSRLSKNKLISFFSLCLLMLVNVALANTVEQDYFIHVEINPQSNVLYGTVEITPISDMAVDISGLDSVKLKDAQNESSKDKLSQILQSSKLQRVKKTEHLYLKAGIKQTIQYQYSLNSFSAYSDKDNVILTGAWYPQINQLAKYHLSVNLPEGFQAISEADKITSKAVDYKRIEYQFEFPYLLDNLTLSASSNYQKKYRDYAGIQVETWFMPGNAHLADNYIDHAVNYLEMYHQMLGPYPFKRFAMVESPLQSGYSMPSYTLLGSSVIALPFIVKTSLGHEILHQWFGNSVYIDHQHGNWCEGLTNYLADYYYADLKGQGKNYRKELLRQYYAYVNQKNVVPVRKFLYRKDKSSSAIGYGKTAMIFHQLQQYYGKEKFLQALRRFIQKNKFRQASWHDLQREFESIDGSSLYKDFNDWLIRSDIADIDIEKKAELKISQGKLWLNFSLRQNLKQDNSPYHLHLPLLLNYTSGRKQSKLLHFTQAKQDFSIELSEPPLSAYLDADYHLMRQLSDEEKVPDLAWLMGKIAADNNVLLAASDNQYETYQPFIDRLGIKDKSLLPHKELSLELINSHSVVIAGYDNFLVKMLFAQQPLPKNGVDLVVKANPYNENEVIVLLSAKNKHQALLAAKKLSHYGKYSQLAFNDGKLSFKHITDSQNGIKLFEQTPVLAVKPAQTESLDDIVANFGNKRVMLIGEQHDRFEHHLNQLLLIKKLKDAGHKVAIGMEMFQQPYQQALDDYISGKITETEFLTNSKYFNKWRYDYNLYKPIIDYAVKHKLPLLALNIEGNITREVAKNGIDALEESKQKQLPDELDFSDRRYRSDLELVFQAHQQMQPDVEKNFNYFLQSQVLWDESMAQTANNFLQQHPQHVLVVIAGNGHLRYRYGIPQRLKRLSGLSPLVVVQDEELDAGIADYTLVTQPINGASTPKLGVYLKTDNLDSKSIGQVIIKEVTKSSVAKKAGLEKGDIIVKLDGKLLKSFSDLKLALLYADTSKALEVLIKRGEKFITKLLRFNSDTIEQSHYSYGKVHGK